MQFLDYGGETIALVTAQPNWRVHPRLELLLPFTDVTTGISHRETRRNFGRTSRYSFAYTPKFRSAKESTDFRLALLRLKDEPVAVPLWTDSIKLTAAEASGQTNLSVTGTESVRSGIDAVIMNSDGSVFEFIAITGGDGTYISIANPTTLSWPIGTRIYPLLFGRFAERPDLESITPSTVSGGLRFREDSPYARRLNVQAGTVATVGANIPEFSATALWDVYPNWNNVLDSTEVDILYQAIGFGREDQTYVYQQSVRRGLEMEFVCRSRAAIAKVERLFTTQRGPVTSFFIPTFRRDMVPTQSLPISGDTSTILIEESRFEDVDFTEHPGTAFIAIVDPAAVTPKRISSIEGHGLHLTTAVTGSHPVGTTRISHLLLARFAEPKLTWEYITPSRARVRIKFLEVPDEYATPQPAIIESAYLYKFTVIYPGPVTYTLGRYTSYENTITFGGQAHTPAPFSHGSIRQSLKLDQESLDLTSWGGNFSGNPLAAFLPFTLDADLWLEVTEVNAASPNDGAARVIFYGSVWELTAKGVDWKAKCVAFGRFFDRKFPRFLVQKTDNYVQDSPPTGLTLASFDETSTISAIAADHIDVATLAQASEYFSAGWFTTGSGSNRERRAILKSTLLGGGGQRIYINRPLTLAVVDQAITLYPGYDGSFAQCDTKFANSINFGGHPYVPDTGPQIKAIEAKQVSGGKKG